MFGASSVKGVLPSHGMPTGQDIPEAEAEKTSALFFEPTMRTRSVIPQGCPAKVYVGNDRLQTLFGVFFVPCRDQDMEVRQCVVGGCSANVTIARVHGCTRAGTFATVAGEGYGGKCR